MSNISIVKETLEMIIKELQNASVPRPSQQLSGHAGGLPFETLVHKKLIDYFPNSAFRHYEALNYILQKELDTQIDSTFLRNFTYGPPPINYLVARGKEATKKWSADNQFEEKQNDTAESIIFSDPADGFKSDLVTLIDIKSQLGTKKAQAPNIISAKKLATTAKLVLEGKVEPNFDFLYVGVKFNPETLNDKKLLVAKDWIVIDLMKIDPATIYINWAAALQIQFHPFEVNQSFEGSKLEWFKGFIETYIKSLKNKINKDVTELKKIEYILETYSNTI